MKVKDVHEFLSSLAEESFPEEGVRFGDPEMDVRGVLFCWMASVSAIRQAIEQGCNLIVCHEAPFLGRAHNNDYSPFYHWKANRLRKELLEDNPVVQCHRTLDAFCIADVLQQMLGLGDPAVAEQMAGYTAVRLFEIEPTPLRELVERWKRAVGLSLVRAHAPDLDHAIRRIGLCWGGIGLHSNMALMARLVDLGAELLLGGETEEYSIEFCADAGVDFVELGHVTTELPGVKEAARHFARQFPELKVTCYDEQPLWRFI